MKALLLVVPLAACSPYTISDPVTPPAAPARGGVASVCVLRSSAFAQGVTFVVHDNATLVGATKGDSYFCYEAEPGAHDLVSDTFDSTDTPGRLHVELAANERAWILQDHDNHFGAVTSILAPLAADRAQALLPTLAYRVLTATPGHEHVPPAVPFARVATR